MRRWGKAEWVAVASGVVVIAIPTAVGIWNREWDKSALQWMKFCAMGVWLIAAGLVIAWGLKRDGNIDRLTAETKQWREHTTSVVEPLVYRAMLGGQAIFDERWKFTIYVHVGALLTPVWPSPLAWPPHILTFGEGKGATGLAWIHRGVVVKYGDDVHNNLHGLTPEQQEAFKDYRAVASTRIYSDRGVAVGVLSAISLDEDHFFDDSAAQALFKEAALAVGTVMAATLEAEADD